MSPAVTVVIPTLAETKRAEGLRRAVTSVLAQEGCVARPLLVVNGDRFDPALVEEWKAHPEMRLYYEPIGSAPLASKIGRSLVDTDFFAFLDNDDEYLPHALVARLSALRTDSRLAAVVGNGYRCECVEPARGCAQSVRGIACQQLVDLLWRVVPQFTG